MKFAAFLILAASLLMPAQVLAEGSDWGYEISPYLFATGLAGDTGVNGVTAEVDMDFGDILDRLDSAVMVSFAASNDRWTILTDVIYARLKDEKTRDWQGPGGLGPLTGALEATVTEEVFHLAIGYRVAPGLDLIGGARYTSLDVDLDLVTTTGGLLPGGTRRVSGDQSWWDPIVGVRYVRSIGDHWSFRGQLDYGFGSGDSDGSYQLLAGFERRLGESWSTRVGYRNLTWDFEDDGFIWDMTMEGAFLGFTYRF